ncbi:MAG: helix-turn-helix domain-containing protein [Chloroflexota bacterium]|nr:helix-turn-helix domain-containing protein [Chloroflexota bacterium]
MRDIRKRLGLSQEELARRLGISGTTVARWESGRSRPSNLAVQAMKRLLEQTCILEEDGE